MSVSTTITVTRDDEEIEVDVTGTVERIGSYNPHERGLRVTDVSVDTPGVTLTAAEYERAEERLYEQL